MSAAEYKVEWNPSWRGLAGALLALARNRLELFAVELQEEKIRALNVVLRLAVALAFVLGGFLVGVTALALWLWEMAGYFGLIALGLALLAVGFCLFALVQRRMESDAPAFSATVEQFQKDRACLLQDKSLS